MADSSISIDAVHQNDSLNAHGINDPLFHTCWRRQSCQYCLQGDVTCSWCPIVCFSYLPTPRSIHLFTSTNHILKSSTCVPNPNTFPILAPIKSSTICPLSDKERWELRATPLGCDVSTITFLTAVVTIMSTLMVVGLVFVAAWAWKRVMSWYQEGKLAEWRDGIFGTGDSRGSDSDADVGREEEECVLGEDVDDRERRPLLG